MVNKGIVLALIVSFSIPALAGEKGGACHHAHESSTAEKTAEGGIDTPQKTCPVGGESISKDSYVDYEGKRVYLCCDGCAAVFRKDPAKYLKKLGDRGEKVLTIAAVPQKTCPVMGGAVNKEIFVDHDGARVYLCCEGCREPFAKNPTKYLKKLEGMGEVPEKI